MSAPSYVDRVWYPLAPGKADSPRRWHPSRAVSSRVEGGRRFTTTRPARVEVRGLYGTGHTEADEGHAFEVMLSTPHHYLIIVDHSEAAIAAQASAFGCDRLIHALRASTQQELDEAMPVFAEVMGPKAVLLDPLVDEVDIGRWARCSTCRGQGWHVGDCHPRQTCRACCGLGELRWLIAGGEASSSKRAGAAATCDLGWLARLAMRAAANRVPFWVERLGSRYACEGVAVLPAMRDPAAASPAEWPEFLQVCRQHPSGW